MKLNIRSLLLSSGLAIMLAACGNNAGVQPASSDAASAASAEHKHSYRCPMNCENGKTYDKPGKCPVCGMTLEHFDEGEDNGLTYKMNYASNPATLKAGEPATLSFTPKVAGKESEDVALDLQHEKKIHLIVVSDDLSYFEHVHPEYGADGTYSIKVLGKGQSYREGPGINETRFEHGGNYVLFADYKPTGGAHQVEKVPFTVAGTQKPKVTFNTEKLSGTSGNYAVTLSAEGGRLITGTQVHLMGTVSKDGKVIDANTLDNYLGAKAHMVVLSMDDKEYLHVHPNVSEGKFDLHTTFKKPGIYRGWIQFRGEDKVHTIDFTLNVSLGTAQESKKAAEGHGGGSDTHAGH